MKTATTSKTKKDPVYYLYAKSSVTGEFAKKQTFTSLETVKKVVDDFKTYKPDWIVRVVKEVVTEEEISFI
jgi:hypothetical protein